MANSALSCSADHSAKGDARSFLAGKVARRFGLSADTATRDGRSFERYIRIAFTTGTSVIAKVAAILTVIISVPLTIRYLGMERYGLWMTIASMVTMLSCADLGIGNGLLTLISETNGKGDIESAKRYISSAFCMLSCLSILVLVGALLAYPFIQWKNFFNVASPDAIRDSGPTFLVLICCFALNMPLGVTQRVHSGYQEGYIASLWAIFGSCLSLIAIVSAIHMHASLPWLVLGLAGAPVVAISLNTVWLFGYSKPWFRPSLLNVQFRNAKRLFRSGVLFFILQVALAVGFQSDSIVLAHILGAEKVGQYALVVRIFSILPQLLNFAIMPLWPAYGEAFARGDVAWLKRTLRRSMILALGVAVPVNGLLIFIGRPLLKMWIGPQAMPSLALLVGLAISQTLMALASPVSVFLNALNVLKFQAVCFSLMAVVNISTSIYLTHRIGISGVVYGSVIAQVLCWIAPSLVYVPKFLSSLREHSSVFSHGPDSLRPIVEG